MVDPMAATPVYRKQSARLTPGELEVKTNAGLFLSPNTKQGNGEYIPAYKGPTGRRLPMTDALAAEAAQLQDADLDLRINSKYDRVFGNTLFEDSSESPSPRTPGAVKMNNLFEDPSTKRSDQTPRKAHEQERDSNASKAERGLSQLFRRDGSARRGHQHHHQQPQPGTMVEAFDAQAVEEEDAHPAVAVVPHASPPPALREMTAAVFEAELKQLIATGQREEALCRPAPSEGMVKCYVKRVKNFFGTHCSFQMHLDSGDVFLMAARRRKKSKVSSYVLSLDLEDLRRDTDNCSSKLKANFVGTEYMLWGRSEDRSVMKGYGRQQLCLNFKQTALSTKGGPRALYAALPIPDTDWQPSAPDGSDSLSSSLELARRRELPPYLERKIAMLATKQPEWDGNAKAFTLDFHGRVREASVKNFQLVHWDHNTDQRGVDVVLQFGKIEEDVYALDFAYPINAQAAFAIALASIDTKLCYTL